MVIDDIVKSISKMSSEEIEARLREIRHSRVTPKDVGTKPTQRPTKRVEEFDEDILDLFSALTQEEKIRLAKNLGV